MTACALAAGAGDRRALERFIRATQRDVWRFLAHLTHLDLADDLTQETYLRALPSLPRFAGRSTARTWLFSIARRVAVDNVRSALTRPKVAAIDDWATSAETRHASTHQGVAGFEDIVEMTLLLADLSSERREALVLTQVLGLSYNEVAEICDCPVGTVRSRIARAREDLLRADGTRRTSSG
ncbi:sigma-70 family RNA polymerase sigma factor [Actinokineospora sp. HBU206404]|uniref:RNA polymerase sigma factor n=1 Tax=Actinokineospora xionganensis TaxID=2684470 RepID=A0ABR7LCY8_9PSEU|nr:sigma-70 family RNA polymerase sigma factor [Actinokineospora xionganensis]